MITKKQIVAGLKDLGVKEDMELEVHSSLSSFGFVEGGAMAVIDAIK
ncbi:MAG: Aminoglycoside 3-N-acetyltransferase, partial [Anaerocolumna sp.]|nr:Aminoglycoside 3-N-acetyltransferase [Anaerocolumna sp.]